MRIVQINTCPDKSTGSIMMGIHKLLIRAGYDSYVAWGRGRDPNNNHEIAIKDPLGVNLHALYTRITDRTGFASQSATRRLIKHLNTISPDIIHLHNIHGYYLNIELLCNYIRTNKIKVVWTMHDCWPISGHCAYFDMVCCRKWITGCRNCEQKYTYPKSSLMDSSDWNWRKKRKLFTGLDVSIVTPSYWLKHILEESFMKEYPIQVFYNGIDLNVFKPMNNSRNKKHYSTKKKIVLGVASEWTERKGLVDFIRLSEKAHDLQFVIVGLTKKQIKTLPSNIIRIERTNSAEELATLYSMADVFLNATYSDNFPTTNLEALACGTPVVTYDTGGSPESVKLANEKSGSVVGIVVEKESSTKADLNKVLSAIRELSNMGKRNAEGFRDASSIFDMNNCLKQYLDLYKEILDR